MALIGRRNHNQINTEKKFQLIICLAAYHKFHSSSESARNLASQLLRLPRRLFLLFHQPVYSSHAFSTCRSILPTPSVPVLTLVTCRNALCTCPSTRLTPSPPAGLHFLRNQHLFFHSSPAVTPSALARLLVLRLLHLWSTLPTSHHLIFHSTSPSPPAHLLFLCFLDLHNKKICD